MRLCHAAAVSLCTILLSGCFESPTDLLAGHTSRIESAETLMVFRNGAYYFANGMLCQQFDRPDLVKGCSGGQKIALERTAQGNYIVSVQNMVGSFVYGLWMRSGRKQDDKVGHCLYWLGEAEDLPNWPRNTKINTRDELLKIVDRVEIPAIMKPEGCERLHARETGIHISWDRRSEPEFE